MIKFTQKCVKKTINFTFFMIYYKKQEMEMERKIYKNLLDWKFSENRKPLILQGARQVGKTYIVNVS